MEEVIKVLEDKITEMINNRYVYLEIKRVPDYSTNIQVERMIKYYSEKIEMFNRAIEMLKTE